MATAAELFSARVRRGGNSSHTAADLFTRARGARTRTPQQQVNREGKSDFGVPQQDVSSAAAVLRGGANRFVDNVADLPQALFEAVTPRRIDDERLPLASAVPDPLELISRGISMLTGGAIDPTASAGRVRNTRVAPTGQDVRAGFRAGADVAGDVIGGAASTAGQVVNAMSSRGILGIPDAARAVIGGAGDVGIRGAFQRGRAAEQDADRRFQEQAPIATAVGEFAGDVGTILTGRAPFRAASVGRAATPVVETQAKTIMARSLQAVGRSTGRTGRRALEAGVEGAALAELQGEDAVQTGATAAGAQVVGAPLRSTFQGLVRPKNLLMAVGLGTVATLGFDQLTPGGLNRILPSLEEANLHAILGVVLGGAATLGTGRVPANFAGSAFSELANVTSRKALLSLLTSVADDPVQTAPVVRKFSEDPDFFGPRARRLLQRSLTSADIDTATTVETLMNDREFRRRFRSLEQSPGTNQE